MNSSTMVKRRAAAGIFLALLGLSGCVLGVLVAERMEEATLVPKLNLEPVIRGLQQVTDLIPNGADAPPGGYQQALQSAVANRSDILAAALVSEGGTIIAAYPDGDQLVNNRLTAPLPGTRYPISGLTASQPGPDGFYPFLRPDDPANNAFGAGEYGSVSRMEPQVTARFIELMRSFHGADWPKVMGLTMRKVVRPDGSSAGELLVLPRPHLAAYVMASGFLLPGFTIGALASLLAYWLMLPWWTYLDARPRTEKAVPLAVFVLLTNFLGWLTYLVIRPEGQRLCPVCVELIDPGFRCCPHCGWTSQARCRQCGRPARSDWRFCPYCEALQADAARGEPELAGTPAQPPPPPPHEPPR